VVVDFCASCSVRPILALSSSALLTVGLAWAGCGGGRVSLTRGIPLAMDVSEVPVFRGGGGPASKDRGWYAVLVCILRFVDMREGGAEENDRRTC
jgi:hypothetical protein